MESSAKSTSLFLLILRWPKCRRGTIVLARCTSELAYQGVGYNFPSLRHALTKSYKVSTDDISTKEYIPICPKSHFSYYMSQYRLFRGQQGQWSNHPQVQIISENTSLESHFIDGLTRQLRPWLYEHQSLPISIHTMVKIVIHTWNKFERLKLTENLRTMHKDEKTDAPKGLVVFFLFTVKYSMLTLIFQCELWQMPIFKGIPNGTWTGLL